MNIMKFVRYILPPFIVLMFILLLAYNSIQHNLNIKADDVSAPEFSEEQTNYIQGHGKVSVYVDPDLQYLTGEGNNGYINDYVSSVFNVADIKAVIVTDEEKMKECDCILMPIDDSIRKEEVDKRYSMPLMQVDGALFVREDKQFDNEGDGLILKHRLSKTKIDQISYNGYAFEKKGVASNKRLVAKALADNSGINYFVGDRDACLHYLGDDNSFIAKSSEMYKLNVCMVFFQQDSTICDIANICINSIDRQAMSYEKSSKWAPGGAPIYEKNGINNIYVIFLIVVLAVVLAFLLYYIANKNLYVELENRMSKLIASRKELQTTFNGISYFLAELTRDGVIIDVNKAFYEYLNLNPANKRITEVIHLNEHTSVLMEDMIQAANRGEVPEGFEVSFNRRFFLIETFPVEGSSGQVEKLLFMCSDVTKEKMAEKQMIQDNKMIAVGQLASGIAHEIRNPLGIIRNYCYVLKTMKDESIKATAIQRIEEAVETSGAIIENLLDFSRSSAKKIGSVNVHEHILSMIQLNESLIKKKDISVEVECKNEVNATLFVESFDMILINLIKNAIDAMDPQGKIKITVTDNESYGLFRVDVEDNGSGIDPDTLSEIFNPFFTTKIDTGGTGLGLYIVYNEIEKMNGTISVESILGEGTTFRIVLPISVTE